MTDIRLSINLSEEEGKLMFRRKDTGYTVFEHSIKTREEADRIIRMVSVIRDFLPEPQSTVPPVELPHEKCLNELWNQKTPALNEDLDAPKFTC